MVNILGQVGSLYEDFWTFLDFYRLYTIEEGKGEFMENHLANKKYMLLNIESCKLSSNLYLDRGYSWEDVFVITGRFSFCSSFLSLAIDRKTYRAASAIWITLCHPNDPILSGYHYHFFLHYSIKDFLSAPKSLLPSVHFL